MQRPSPARINAISRQLLPSCGGGSRSSSHVPSYDVFISHGVDTKQNVAGLLYHRLRSLGLQPFLGSNSMNPGDKSSDMIHVAIQGCKVGVAVFSPMYCESYMCLHELSLMVENEKRVVPIFCDVKPSELRVGHEESCPSPELEKYRSALEEAKCTVGVTFDTIRGDWPELLENAADAVIKNLIEVEEDR